MILYINDGLFLLPPSGQQMYSTRFMEVEKLAVHNYAKLVVLATLD